MVSKTPRTDSKRVLAAERLDVLQPGHDANQRSRSVVDGYIDAIVRLM
jgi:hypothetical protein